jgi:predicted oxidoreductase
VRHPVPSWPAEKKGVSLDAILVAWLLRHPAGIQPVIGTTNPQRIKETCAADTVGLTREEWYALLAAGTARTVA